MQAFYIKCLNNMWIRGLYPILPDQELSCEVEHSEKTLLMILETLHSKDCMQTRERNTYKIVYM